MSKEMNDTLSPDQNDTLSPDQNDTLSPDTNDTLSPDTNDTLSPDQNDTLGVETDIGVSKDQFMQALRAACGRGMKFDLVAMDSCESALSSDAERPFDIIGSTSKIGYQSVDYAALAGIKSGELSGKVAGLFRASGKFH